MSALDENRKTKRIQFNFNFGGDNYKTKLFSIVSTSLNVSTLTQTNY